MDVVFDLDWTAIYPTSKHMAEIQPENIIRFGEDYFRLADHLIPVLRALHEQPGIRVSFFSGGSEDRNMTVIQEIYRRLNLDGSTYSPFKTLHSQNLHIASTDSTLSFAQRFKKNLSPYFDLDRVILIDDVKEFSMPGQEKNLLWLSKTYNDRPEYNLVHLEPSADRGYSAPHFEAWQSERRKILNLLEPLLVAHHWRNQMSLPEALSRALSKKSILCRRIHIY